MNTDNELYVSLTRSVEIGAQVDHPVLKHYFPKVSTLRDYLVADLEERNQQLKIVTKIADVKDPAVAQILDTVIVGNLSNSEKPALRERRAKDVLSFTQQLPSSTIGSSNDNVAHSAQLEVVDFVIWLLFRRSQSPARPQHLLSQGFDRFAAKGQHGLNLSAAPGIPGIICRYSNAHIEYVTSNAWCALLSLFGKGGDIIMVDLLLECCLFLPASDNSRSLQQFSGISSFVIIWIVSSDPAVGIPLSSLRPYSFSEVTSNPKPPLPTKANKNWSTKNTPLPRQPSAVKFVRNRMFFAQPSLSANGRIRFGLHSIRKSRVKSPHNL
jgi:hypothetical protein